MDSEKLFTRHYLMSKRCWKFVFAPAAVPFFFRRFLSRRKIAARFFPGVVYFKNKSFRITPGVRRPTPVPPSFAARHRRNARVQQVRRDTLPTAITPERRLVLNFTRKTAGINRLLSAGYFWRVQRRLIIHAV